MGFLLCYYSVIVSGYHETIIILVGKGRIAKQRLIPKKSVFSLKHIISSLAPRSIFSWLSAIQQKKGENKGWNHIMIYYRSAHNKGLQRLILCRCDSLKSIICLGTETRHSRTSESGSQEIGSARPSHHRRSIPKRASLSGPVGALSPGLSAAAMLSGYLHKLAQNKVKAHSLLLSLTPSVNDLSGRGQRFVFPELNEKRMEGSLALNFGGFSQESGGTRKADRNKNVCRGGEHKRMLTDNEGRNRRRRLIARWAANCKRRRKTKARASSIRSGRLLYGRRSSMIWPTEHGH